MKLCPACHKNFLWNDMVIITDDEVYHEDCVKLYPTSYYVMIGDEILGETDGEGLMAYEILNDEEVIDDEIT